MFYYENKLTFPIHIAGRKFENSMDFFLLTDEIKSHCVYIKNFNTFMFYKTKNKSKKYFCNSSLECISSKNVLAWHKKSMFKH